LKLSTEVGNINYRIDQFRNNMSKVLTSELKALREEILRLVDEAFKESERSIRELMKMEEERLASDMLKMRETLEKEYVRVEAMREDINKPQWRKVTGEILAT
jgi:predicted translin family RNA/ssDNA-binding protein